MPWWSRRRSILEVDMWSIIDAELTGDVKTRYRGMSVCETVPVPLHISALRPRGSWRQSGVAGRVQRKPVISGAETDQWEIHVACPNALLRRVWNPSSASATEKKG